ncbi:type II secretion system protein [Clostridium fermenticellae]|uniref:Type II secretion system protein n=1 Tax=Clostridium fermenticellae TaxID=2068654 RepID=A0A386H4L1_9CLOT|nr:prepilin-type N-terminal cleavage/methylation domain-containing protein [Clostridium fermenticellae]AYD40610.1 type II secretion system protein [Clostridium fermenticellae]
MLSLKNNKGFTLIEVMLSISLFSILFISALSVQTASYRIQKYCKKMYTYSIFEEYVKNNLLYNCTYDEIQQLRSQTRIYMEYYNINSENIDRLKFTKMFVNNIPGQKTYIKLDISGDKILKINIGLYSEGINKRKIMECEIYKGKYKS